MGDMSSLITCVRRLRRRCPECLIVVQTPRVERPVASVSRASRSVTCAREVAFGLNARVALGLEVPPQFSVICAQGLELLDTQFRRLTRWTLARLASSCNSR